MGDLCPFLGDTCAQTGAKHTFEERIYIPDFMAILNQVGGNQQMMIAKRQSRLVVSFIIISMLLQAFVSVPVFAQPETADEAVLVSAPATVDDDGITRTLNSLNEMKDLMVSTTYAEYHELYGDIPKATETITIKATDYDRELTTAAVEIREDS